MEAENIMSVKPLETQFDQAPFQAESMSKDGPVVFCAIESKNPLKAILIAWSEKIIDPKIVEV